MRVDAGRLDVGGALWSGWSSLTAHAVPGIDVERLVNGMLLGAFETRVTV